MNESWQQFLARRHPETDASGAILFDSSPTHERAVALAGEALIFLRHLGIIELVGVDATDFLNGQLTSDLLTLETPGTQLAAHCTYQGRTLAVMRIWRIAADHYYLTLPKLLIEDLQARLRMYVLRAQVQLRDASDDWVLLGGASERFARVLPANAALVGRPLALDGDDLAWHLSLADQSARRLVLANPETARSLWIELCNDLTPAGPDAWRLLDIRAGMPEVWAETQGEFVPQMLNLDLLNGISFTKGCYVGQEVVARLKFLGQVNRRMFRAVALAKAPAPGTPLFDAGDNSDRPCGKVVTAVDAEPGESELLAVVTRSARQQDDVYIGSDRGPRLEFAPLPYPLDLPNP